MSKTKGSLLAEFGTGQGYLKAGFLGFAKSGKTFTAALLAIELHKRLKLDGPIALFDTESGGEYVAPMLTKAIGRPPVGLKSRALSDLMAVGKECADGASGVLIVDSITHVWREVGDAYLDQVNKARAMRSLPPRRRLEFQDWKAIKDKWNIWTDFYLNAPLHIIICGRAGFEWEFQDKEDTAGNVHKELVKTGVKMKVEGEFGFEPSLLVEMERVQVPDETRRDGFTFTHRARVLGDRFDVMDGAVTDNPTGAWFAPHMDMLSPGAINVVDVELKTDMGVDERGDAEWTRERKRRKILCEEIQGEIVKAYPGQTKEEKKAKVELLETHFQTTSWTAVENMKARDLQVGLDNMREVFAEQAATEAKEAKSDD